MITRHFRYLDRQGRLQVATHSDDSHFAEQLKQDGGRVLSVRRAWATHWYRRMGSRRLAREWGGQAEQLACLLESGQPIDSALENLQSASPRHWQWPLEQLLTALRQGFRLAPAMRRQSDVFGELSCALVSAGERSGRLAEVLMEIHHLQADRQRWRDELRAAVQQPLLTLVLLLAAAAVLLFTLLPSLAPLLADNRLELGPLAERLLRWVEHTPAWHAGSGSSGLLMAGVTLALLWFSRKALVDALMPLWFDSAVGRHLVQAGLCNQFARIFALLYREGVAIPEALTLAQASLGVNPMAQRIAVVHRRLVEGMGLGEAFAAEPALPPRLRQAMSLAETGAALDHTLEHCARAERAVQKRAQQRLQTLAGPSVLLLGGALLAWLVMAVFMPLYSVVPEFAEI